jgi:phosphinothricin acetyltransferase
MASTIVITDTTEADIPAITAMFATEVRHGTASWAYEPPTHDEMLEKFQRLTADNYPFLTARLDNQESTSTRTQARTTTQSSVSLLPVPIAREKVTDSCAKTQSMCMRTSDATALQASY